LIFLLIKDWTLSRVCFCRIWNSWWL